MEYGIKIAAKSNLNGHWRHAAEINVKVNKL